ncbi:MAG: hypothetical protein M1820_004755 [Bogoriella megaspora]|nr:MAG: hypothetical protein M1820_004755 [Bogoriella megaspora]
MARWFGLGDASSRISFDNACANKFRKPLDLLGPATLRLPNFTTYDADRGQASVIAKPLLNLNELQEDDNELKAEGILSLVLLLDQCSRNIFRQDQTLVYQHYDRLARALVYCMLGLQVESPISSIDTKSSFRSQPPWRSWLYMPLMHSEDLQDHKLFTDKINNMVQEQQQKDQAKDYISSIRQFEEKHNRILKRFGRYPHRNQAMKREATPAEISWLQEGGDTFGTR